jgi:hypothetical protein
MWIPQNRHLARSCHHLVDEHGDVDEANGEPESPVDEKLGVNFMNQLWS